MDAQFLSQPQVVAASKNFVCIRLATYESAAEAEVLKSIFVGRSGDLENTTFAILSPDGEKLLVRPGRSPKQILRGDDPAQLMADTMNRLAKRYKAKDDLTPTAPGLPTMADARVALNVAACDLVPLVIVLGRDESELDRLTTKLAGPAWSEDLVGRFAYAATLNSRTLPRLVTENEHRAAALDGLAGYLIVYPDAYGQTGVVQARLGVESGAASLAAAMAEALRGHDPQRADQRRHIAEGHRKGMEWKTAIHVTDPGPATKRRP